MFLRYDVELYQRIEQLIEKKLPQHPMVEEEVMLLVERVTEAQRHARMVNNFLKEDKVVYTCNVFQLDFNPSGT